MSLEILQSIEQAEGQAEQVRSKAQREARDMLKGVEAACVVRERAAAIDHRGLYQQLMEQNRLRVAETLAKQSQELANERAALCKAAEARLDQAATQIFERIVRHGQS